MRESLRKDIASLLLRIGISVPFIFYGILGIFFALMPVETASEVLNGIGLNYSPIIFLYVISFLELLIGLLLLIGLFTKFSGYVATLILLIIMITRIVFLNDIPRYLNVVLFAGCYYFSVMGGRKLSLDYFLER